MRNSKHGGRRNYGWGRQMLYAVKNALRDFYANGQYSNRGTLLDRAGLFVDFVRGHNIRDLRDVTREMVVDYADYVADRRNAGEIGTRYATNLISAVNCVFRALRRDEAMTVSPKAFVGKRNQVRTEPVQTADTKSIQTACEHVASRGYADVAAIVRLSASLGLRHKEASLLDVPRALQEARNSGYVSVSRGTKGGRDRCVQANERALRALEFARDACMERSKLIPNGLTTYQWYHYSRRIWQRHTLGYPVDAKFKEFRAFFAGKLYERESGGVCPTVAGGRTVSRDDDRRARLRVARDLGHGREQIAGAYVGTTKRVSNEPE